MRARRLAATADLACALSLEALQGSRTSFLPAVHAPRPLKGQQDAAANVWRLLEGSAIIESHRWCDKVQDAYSLRCAPQVHGACRDLLDYVEATVAVELNAATDNPLVLVERRAIVVSHGNFHGQPLAFALDALAIAVAELASISERRVERLVNPTLSDGLPPFLVEEGGLNSGFMIPQYVAAALVSREQGARAPGERRLDPDERRPGGPRLDGERGRAQGAAASSTTSSARSRSSCSPARRRSSSSRRCARRGRARGARRRARALAAADGGPVAERGHRARRGGDPNVRRDRRGGRVARSACSRDGRCSSRRSAAI